MRYAGPWINLELKKITLFYLPNFRDTVSIKTTTMKYVFANVFKLINYLESVLKDRGH